MTKLKDARPKPGRTVILFVIPLLFLGMAVSTVFAQEKTFIREYTYEASETDSKVTSRQKALKEVKALLIEELGIYVESYVNYEVVEENKKITKDFFTNEIKTISAGTTQTTILEESWDGYQYFIRAEIDADPEEVLRRINQTLSKRKSSEVIDSLNALLTSSNVELKMLNEEFDLVKGQLSEQQIEVIKKQKELDSLNDQLAEANEELEKYQVEQSRILSEIERIELLIKNSGEKALANIRIGMTPEEVRRLCGKPRAVDVCRNFNYGTVWVIFEVDIVRAIVDFKDFEMCKKIDSYERDRVDLLLK